MLLFPVNLTIAEKDFNWGNILFIVTMDSEPPVITHTPVRLINIVGNKIIIEGNITDDMEILYFNLFYKKHSETEYKQITENFAYIAIYPEAEKIKNHAFRLEIPPLEIPPGVVTIDGVDYYITATDNAGNTSCFSGVGYTETVPSPVVPIEIEVNPTTVRVVITSQGGTIILIDANPEDGETQLVIPPGALTQSTEIFIRQIIDLDALPRGNGATATDKPIAAYEFFPDKLLFNKPVMLSLLYFDLDQDGIVDGTNIPENNLRVFWWDGYDWRYVGGKVDNVRNLVTTEIMHFSIYGLFPAKQLSASDYRPKNKIITPATIDGINDFAEFDGLQGRKVTIKIFDVTGKKIRTISSEPYRWDGRDDEERLVESGVYIYQFEVDGELISGMIAVAK